MPWKNQTRPITMAKTPSARRIGRFTFPPSIERCLWIHRCLWIDPCMWIEPCRSSRPLCSVTR
jgi:hypothetical protein